MVYHTGQSNGYKVSHKVEIKEIDFDFKSLFAKEDITKGEYIFQRWNDRCLMLAVKEVEKLSPEHRVFFEKYAIELLENTFIGPYEKEDISSMPEYFINHSCDPNTWLVSDEDVAARYNIKKGEQITIDYATFIANKFESSRINQCLCRTAICRGKVDDDWWRMRDVYKGHFLSWIQRKIDEREKTGLK